jgi:hypothetical protein
LLDDNGQFLPGASFARDCPYCHTASATASLVLQAYGMHLMRCAGCALVYSREVINRAFEQQRYQASQAADANMALKIDPHYAALEQDKARYVMARLGSLAGTGSVLDIGSSTGALLQAAQAAGWTARGGNQSGSGCPLPPAAATGGVWRVPMCAPRRLGAF